MLTVKKCDGGVPLPEGSRGTWFTWDVWDDAEQRTVSRHATREAARDAAQLMTEHPHLRELLERVIRSNYEHGVILAALVSAATRVP